MGLPEKINLSLYKQKKEFLLKTAQQLEKDFASEGFKFDLPEKDDVTYNSLYKIVYPHIEKLLNTQPYKLQQLIYRIDLPENAYSDTIQNSTEPASELTQLIIQRELLKVVIRNHYSNKP